MKSKTTSPLVVKGEIAVDGAKFPALRRALERGRDYVAKSKDGWAQVAELRRSGQPQAAERLLRDLLGIKGDPMPEDVKAALRAKRAAMTDEEKRAEREERKANRVLKRLAARAAGRGLETTNTEVDVMAKKTKKSKAVKKGVAKSVKPNAPKERDPRLPAPGSMIEREYRNKQLKVKVLDQGFEFDGETYSSLSALAKKITGAGSINGLLFFRLTTPKPVEAK